MGRSALLVAAALCALETPVGEVKIVTYQVRYTGVIILLDVQRFEIAFRDVKRYIRTKHYFIIIIYYGSVLW